MNRKQIALLAAAAAFVVAGDGAFAANAGNIDQAPDDDYVMTEVKALLARQTATAELPISVSSVDGVVSLSGPVSTINQMARAVIGAYGVEGVVRVNNHLQMIL